MPNMACRLFKARSARRRGAVCTAARRRALSMMDGDGSSTFVVFIVFFANTCTSASGPYKNPAGAFTGRRAYGVVPARSNSPLRSNVSITASRVPDASDVLDATITCAHAKGHHVAVSTRTCDGELLLYLCSSFCSLATKAWVCFGVCECECIILCLGTFPRACKAVARAAAETDMLPHVRVSCCARTVCSTMTTMQPASAKLAKTHTAVLAACGVIAFTTHAASKIRHPAAKPCTRSPAGVPSAFFRNFFCGVAVDMRLQQGAPRRGHPGYPQAPTPRFVRRGTKMHTQQM